MKKYNYLSRLKNKNIFVVIIVIWAMIFGIFLNSCSSKNYTIKNDIKKKINFTISLGDSYFNSYRLDKALEAYDEALKKIYLLNDLENEIIVNLKIAQVYILKNDIDNAKKYLDKSEKVMQYFYNDNVYFYYCQVKAQYNEVLKKYDDALDYFTKCLEYTKDKKLIANVYNKIAKVLIKIEKYEKAYEFLNNALKINSSKKFYDGLGDNYYNLALIEFYKKNYNDAINYLKQALDCDKKNENIFGIFSDLNLIADVYYEKGEYEKTLFYLYQAYNLALSSENEVLAGNVKEKINKIEKELK